MKSSFQVDRLKIYFGLAPLFVFGLFTAVLVAFGLRGGPSFNPPYLVLALNTAFLTLTAIAVAYVSAKAYLVDGSFNLLFLGSGVLVSGLAAFFAGWFTTLPDHNVAIFNIGVLISSVAQLLSASITWLGVKSTKATERKSTLVIAYLSAMFAVIIVSISAIYNFLPLFFSPTGPTLIRQVVLILSILFFSLSSLSFSIFFFKTKSIVIYWYSLALAIFAIGLLAVAFITEFNGALNWVARAAQYSSGFYFLTAIWSAGRKK
jgi:hypothetical protein